MMRRRRPLARAALVGGGAYYAGKKHAQGQAEDAARRKAIRRLGWRHSSPSSRLAAAPAPTAAGDDEMVTKLTNLKGLLDSGVLTQAEFDAAKAKVLAGG